jgi:hypothetical protein
MLWYSTLQYQRDANLLFGSALLWRVNPFCLSWSWQPSSHLTYSLTSHQSPCTLGTYIPPAMSVFSTSTTGNDTRASRLNKALLVPLYNLASFVVPVCRWLALAICSSSIIVGRSTRVPAAVTHRCTCTAGCCHRMATGRRGVVSSSRRGCIPDPERSLRPCACMLVDRLDAKNFAKFSDSASH